MLILTSKPNECVHIGDNIVVRVMRVDGNQVKIGYEVPKEIPVHRGVVHDRIKAKEAAKTGL